MTDPDKKDIFFEGNDSSDEDFKIRRVSINPTKPELFSKKVLAVIVILLVVALGTSVWTQGFTGTVTGASVAEQISKEEAKTQAADFINKYMLSNGVSATFGDAVVENGLYKFNVEVNGQKADVYMSQDGKILFLQPIDIEKAKASADAQPLEEVKEVPKSDKPSVELYVFTYCPYGLQMEKAVAPVVKLFGDKINFKIRQIGAMHGEYEKIEAERQLCIEKNYPDKFIDYVIAFAENTQIGDCSKDAACAKPLIEGIYTKLGIDADKINSCMTAEGEALYAAEEKNSQSKGVGGSPTTIINGVDASVGRSPDAVKQAICSAFNTVPSECSNTLSTAAASPGFGSGTGSSTGSASCNG